MNLSPAWFGWLAAELRERFTADGGARVVFNLEGGYNPLRCAVAAGLAIEARGAGR